MLEKEFLDFGYTKEDYILIKNSHGITGYTDETLLKKIKEITKFLLKLDYSKEEVIKMTKSLPTIYGLSIENMKQKIEDMVSLGYSKEEVIKMTKSLPQIYGYSIENMKQKIEDIVSLGYSKEEVIKMTKNLPTIYGLSIENIKQKVNFYDSIEMHQLAVVDSKQLMQSVTLSYARYQFYLSIGIIVDMDNYKKMFIGNKIFEKQYGIGKTELLMLYNYEQFMEERENDRTI